MWLFSGTREAAAPWHQTFPCPSLPQPLMLWLLTWIHKDKRKTMTYLRKWRLLSVCVCLQSVLNVCFCVMSAKEIKCSHYFTECLLVGLKDKETIVRWSAAKGWVTKNLDNKSLCCYLPCFTLCQIKLLQKSLCYNNCQRYLNLQHWEGDWEASQGAGRWGCWISDGLLQVGSCWEHIGSLHQSHSSSFKLFFFSSCRHCFLRASSNDCVCS